MSYIIRCNQWIQEEKVEYDQNYQDINFHNSKIYINSNISTKDSSNNEDEDTNIDIKTCNKKQINGTSTEL